MVELIVKGESSSALKIEKEETEKTVDASSSVKDTVNIIVPVVVFSGT